MTTGREYGMPAGERTQMRAATTDRDRAIELLTKAFTEGRLDKDEYDVRLERALSARTYAELDTVVSDLPGTRPMATAPAAQRTNSLALASFICGFAQLVAGPLATVPAIVLGHMGRRQIRQTGEDGAGLALAGLLMGWAAVALGVIIVVTVVLFVVLVAHGGNHVVVPTPPPPGG